MIPVFKTSKNMPNCTQFVKNGGHGAKLHITICIHQEKILFITSWLGTFCKSTMNERACVILIDPGGLGGPKQIRVYKSISTVRKDNNVTCNNYKAN